MNRVFEKIRGRLAVGPMKRFHRIRSVNSMALENERLKDEISNISHELKTPLATIKEALLLLSEGSSGVLNEKQRRLLDISTQNAERLNHLINDLLDSARQENSGSSMKRSLFSITDSAKTIMSSLDMIARDKGIVLEGAIPDKRIEIWGDPDKLNQVITNLVENAIKYNKPEGKVKVAMEEDEGSVTISVKDTGMGIPKDELGKIFDRFYRVEKNSSKGTPGTGLGLSIVKNIVSMHKGAISVESDMNSGSKFTVALPKSLRR